MLKNLALLVSLAANLGLLALSFLGTDSTAASAAAPAGDAHATRALERRSVTDGAAYFDALKALGLDEHEARLLLAARLEERAMGKLPAPPDRYWEPRQAELARYGAEVAGAQARARDELRAALGTSAESAPELARLFRPLGPRFGFLSPQEQGALQRWQLSRRAAAPAPRVDVRPGRASRADAGSGGDELAELRRVLPGAAAFEVAVRESALAEQLRTSGAKVSEAEFRETYALLADPPAGGDAEALVERRRRLEALLGSQRFDRVWAIRDPLAAVLRDVSAERGLDDAATWRAYGVLNANQGRLTKLAAAGDTADERTVAAAEAIALDERTELARAVGEEDARAILNARNAYFVALSRASPRGPAAGGQ
jgi:hypothetical protein